MISMAVRAFHNLKSIVLMFLERGHTQNENDSVHSAIERSKKGITINHPYQWVSLILGACKSLPYTVKEMEQEEVLNFETELDGSYNLLINGSVTVPVPSKNKKNVKNVPIKWREIRAVCFERESPFELLYKYDLVVPWRVASIGKEMKNASFNNYVLQILTD